MPPSPHASTRARNSGGTSARSTVVFVATMPSAPAASAASTVGSGSSSGEIFTSTGPTRCSSTDSRMRAIASGAWRRRRPGVLGLETLSTA